MGNYSRDPAATLQSALGKGYSRVRFQQGKAILDSELNLAADLASPDRLAQQYIGNGVPAGTTGFQISALDIANGDFTILPGTCLVAGLEVTLASQATYKTQPITARVAPLPAGESGVYLHVFTDEVTSAQDSDLANAGTVGTETSVRLRNNWEVVVSATPINDPQYLSLATIDTTLDKIIDFRAAVMTVSAASAELKDARGNAASLGERLNTSDLSLAAVENEVTTARGTAPALADRMNKSLAPDGAVLPGTVTIPMMASTLVLNSQFSVAAAPAAGQTTQLAITLAVADEPAFLLVSVHFDGPRDPANPAVPLSQSFSWHNQVLLFKPVGADVFNQHIYQVVVENPSLVAISVTCKAYRLAEA